MPELFGGAADLSESNLTDIRGGGDFEAGGWPDATSGSASGSTPWAASRTGSRTTAGFIPYAATFLTFSDYMRGSVRLAALAGLHVIYVWTHDSVGLGEDGPTHQPVEHYAALRAIPNLWFVRPGDANEAVAAWALAVERRDGPVALALTRQKLPTLAGHGRAGARGRATRRVRPAARVVGEGRRRHPVIILVATGSELQLAMGAAEALEAEGTPARVVSLPCWERFEAQDEAYRESVLPAAVGARVTVEAGVSLGWERYAGDQRCDRRHRPLRGVGAGRDDLR